MTFTSTKITRAAGNEGQMTGDLTFLGVTKPVTLDVTYYGAGVAMGATKMGFSATGSIKRSDFGFMTMMGPLGDQVDLQIEAEFIKQ
jgi:polyisoprenoid-binding protein YceI